MAEIHATFPGPTTSTHVSPKPNNSPDSPLPLPILSTLAALIAGELSAEEAAQQLQYFGAASWLIRSVHEIERKFSDPEPDYCGPMAHVVQKVLGRS